MSKKVKKKCLASGKRCRAFFLGEDFEATVHQIPRLVIEQLVDRDLTRHRDTPSHPGPLVSGWGLRPNRVNRVRYSIRLSSGLNARS